MNVKNNIRNFTQNIPDYVKLIAVSKTQPLEVIAEAHQSGQLIFGENKAQELVSKYDALPHTIQWHMIGHLQTNKVKSIVPFVHLIHSVDSLKLLQEINKQGQKFNRVIPCLLQLHIAHEETKFGLSEEETLQLLGSGEVPRLTHCNIMGLMGIATLTENEEQIRSEFRNLKKFHDQLRSQPLPENTEMKELSMGMSSDYKIAIEEGSTMIRVGTAIFGERR